MFNNCNPKTNGEYNFFRYLVEVKKIKTIFDVGSRDDSDFLEFTGEVHYFEPVNDFLEKLKKKENRNSKSYFNNFGLGNENNCLFYYPKYQSFFDRINSCKISDNSSKIILNVKKGDDYINENKITKIDFLKIDTEGFELNVLKGLQNSLNIIDFIQFEYGGTFLDNNVKLIEVINFLKDNNFGNFRYLVNNGTVSITDYTDHYQYCNIICEKV
jgi:FkbM family methyltransferase